MWHFEIMKIIKDILRDIEHIPKCSKSGEDSLYYLIKQAVAQMKG